MHGRFFPGQANPDAGMYEHTPKWGAKCYSYVELSASALDKNQMWFHVTTQFGLMHSMFGQITKLDQEIVAKHIVLCISLSSLINNWPVKTMSNQACFPAQNPYIYENLKCGCERGRKFCKSMYIKNTVFRSLTNTSWYEQSVFYWNTGLSK